MKRVILHAGHGKTGSSLIQSFLALNDERLRSLGIAYPDHPSLERARQRRITSGNAGGRELFDEYIIEKANSQKENTVLFSNEVLFKFIVKHPDRLENVNNQFDLSIIFFVRDPIEYFVSHYSQTVKRRGIFVDMEDYIDEYTLPSVTLTFLDMIMDRSIKLEIINYSNHRHDLIEIFLDKLGLKGEGFFVPDEIVNRSLSAEEGYIARAFNKEFGAVSSQFIADPFCEELPAYRGTALTIPPRVVAELVRKNEAYISEIDARLPEGEKYSRTWRNLEGTAEAAPGDTLVITKKHIDVMAASMKGHFERLEINNGILKEEAERLKQQVRDSQERAKGLIEERNALIGRLRDQMKVQRDTLERLQEKADRLHARVGKLKKRLAARKRKWW